MADLGAVQLLCDTSDFSCWGWSTLGVARAGGNVCGTRTEAASDDTFERSRHSEPADFSVPLPGTRTRDLTKSPVL